jgi:hypothetical protein
VLRDTLPVGGRCLLVGVVASQAERPQARSLFPHRAQFGLVLGHCLLALTQLLFFLEQSFGATMRLIRIHANAIQLRAGALVIGTDIFFFSRSGQLGAMAARHAIPAIVRSATLPATGGLWDQYCEPGSPSRRLRQPHPQR